MNQAVCSQRAIDRSEAHMLSSDEAAFRRDVANYWDHRSQTYSNAILQELAGDAYVLWRSYLRKQIPYTSNKAPRILDLGCGPGFFEILFAEAGCEVVAVDSSKGMLERAYTNVVAAGLEAHVSFHLGDVAHLPEFSSDSFDVVISRNLTWLMRDLRASYAEWLRLLAPGAALFTFDSNWYHYLNDEDLAARRLPDEKAIKAEISADCLASEAEERRCEQIAAQISTTYLSRPSFDKQALCELGAREVIVDDAIWKRLWTPDEQRHYRTAPMFLVKAVK